MHFEATNHIVYVGLTIHTCAKNAQPLIARKIQKLKSIQLRKNCWLREKSFTKLKFKMQVVF